MFTSRTFDKEIESINSKLRDLKQNKKVLEENLLLLEKKKKRLSSGLAAVFGANKSKSYKECEENLKNVRKQLDELNCTITEINLLKKEIKSKYNDAIKLYEQAVENKFDEALLKQSAELGYYKAVEFFKEKERQAKLESRFQKVINSEKIDKNQLKVIADAGHTKARVEMANILIDDYFSKMLTKEEKEQLASTVYNYLKGINTENDVEVELLELFSYTMSSCLEGGIFMKSNLKKIRAIKDNNTLSEKYDSLANKMIQHIVSVIDGHDHSGGSSINYSYLTKNDDVSSSLCAYYQNGCCKHGYNANYNNISCGYSECFHNVCPNYQKR